MTLVKVKILIWYSPILYLVSIQWLLYNLNPSRNSPNLGVSYHLEVIQDQCAAYIPSRASASAVLPYVFAGTHFTYPQRDGRLSQPLARLSGYWTLDLSHDSLLLYQLSYPSLLHLGVSVGHFSVLYCLKGCLGYSTVNIKNVSHLLCQRCWHLFVFYNRVDWFVTSVLVSRIYHGAMCGRHRHVGCCCISVCHMSRLSPMPQCFRADRLNLLAL